MECQNCGTQLVGEFCHACGQSSENPLRSIGSFLKDAVGDEVALGSDTWRTMRALVVPGKLTTEYIAGRRARYIGPLQVYLLAAGLFFLTTTIRPMIDFDPVRHGAHSSMGMMNMGVSMDSAYLNGVARTGIDERLFR